MNNQKNYILYFILLFFSFSAYADSNITIKKDVIQGNSELPKVMYIIPWKTTESKITFRGVQLENYYEKLLKPYHPYKMSLIDKN